MRFLDRISGRHWGLLALLGLVVAQGPAAAETMLISEDVGVRGLVLQEQTHGGVEIHYGMDRFEIGAFDVAGEQQQIVMLPGVFLPNDEGAPNLPGMGRFVAIPEGARPVMSIISSQTRTYQDIDLAPAPPIRKENDDSPITYTRNAAIYDVDANYPASPVAVSPTQDMRGVDVVAVGITPFQYNPVTRELTVYTELNVRLDFAGGTGEFGEERLRSRYWEPLLRDHLMNYSSLPAVDFNTPRGDRQGHEYVIICPDNPEFITWADTLKTWRKLQGIDTEVFTTTDVGGTTTTAIESWLNNAYNNWDTPPAAFLLLGDYPNSGDNRDSGIMSPMWSGYCVSDNIYADVDGNNLPEMAHARICGRNSAEMETMIDKMLTYEREPYTDPGFYDHPLIAGGWQTERWFILCTETIYGHQANVLGKEPVREYAIYSGTPGSIWSSNQNTYMVVNYFGPNGLGYIPATPGHLNDWGGNYVGVNDAINSGAYMILHRDHGNNTYWGEPYYTTAHMGMLTNEMYPFVFSINCLTGKYNYYGECFTERFHRMGQGALGVIAASEISYSFVNDTYIWGMFDSMWPDFDPGYGDSENTGPSILRPAYANASGKWYLQASSFPYNPQHKIYTHHLFHHHGDAFIQMNTEMPANLTVVHDDFLGLDEEAFTVQANADAVIALTVDGEIIGVADATGAPQAIQIVPQTVEGELRVTVTKANHFRYDVTIPIELGTITVAPDGSGDFPTIQAAIDAANEGGLIELTDGTFIGNGNWDVDFHGKQVTVQSQSNDPTACVIDCDDPFGDTVHRGFIFQSGEDQQTILRGIGITGGVAEDDTFGGGAILILDSSPTITGCRLTNNSAVYGGGALHCSGGAPSVLSSTFSENNTGGAGGAMLFEDGAMPILGNCDVTLNTADGSGGGVACRVVAEMTLSFSRINDNMAAAGGGLSCEEGASPSLMNCFLERNSADQGGGLMSNGAAPNLSRCRLADNLGGSIGGAVYCIDGVPVLDRCTLVGNSAPLGGGLGVVAATPQLATSTLYGNAASVAGGGLFLSEGAAPEITNTIIAFGSEGAAVACDSLGVPCTVNLTCCDVFANAGGDWVGCIAGQDGLAGNFSLDPRFCDAPAGDFHLWNNSPCSQVGCGQVGAEGVGCWDQQDVASDESTGRLALSGNLPNPFGSATQIAYRIPADTGGSPVVLEVFDPAGRLVRTLINEVQSPGEHVQSWDGCNHDGARVTSGVYYYQLRVAGESLTRRMVLLN